MNLIHASKVNLVRVFIIILGSLIPSVNLLSQTYSLLEIKENLYRERPQTGDFEIRKLSLSSIDLIASNRYFNKDKLSEYWLAMFNKAVLEIQNEVVTEGATIWLIYNHGFVVKTPTVCFGFDLFDYFDTSEFLQLGDLLDVLFISHVHKDHWSVKLVVEMNKLGKPVVGPSEMPSNAVSKPMSAGDNAFISGLHVIAHYGRHSDPVRQFEVLTPEGIKFLHTGDNNSIYTMHSVAEVDVLMLNAWIEWSGGRIRPDKVKKAIDKVNPRVALPAHINELLHVEGGSTVPHWIDAYLVYGYELPYDYAVLSWGERYHFDHNSNDTIPTNDIENTEYQIGGDSILVTWDPPLISDDGDTASFYRIIIDEMNDHILTEKEYSLAWDSIGSCYSINIYAYDDCGNQSNNPAEIKATVPDLEYPPRIIGSSPGNIDTIEVFSGVSKIFQLNTSDPNKDTLTYTWKINNTVLPEETSSKFIYNIPGLQAGVYKLTATVSDQEFSIQYTWLLNHHNLIAIIDNEDTLMYSDSGNWVTSFYHPGYYNGNCRISSINQKGSWAEFTYFPEIPGNYKVYAFAPFMIPKSSFPVYCIIINDQPVDTIIQDRNPKDGKWTALGNYYFPNSAEVTIRAINTGFAIERTSVFADAILFVHETVSSQTFKMRRIQTEIRLYPNPAQDIVTIETGKSEQCTIEITSINGQLVYRIRMNETKLKIDLSSFQKGVYFITIRSKDFVTTRKIIKL